MKVEFYLDSEKNVQSVAIRSVKRAEPIEFLEKLQTSLEIELPIDSLDTDTYYVAKLKRRYEPDGSGKSCFDGYDVVKVHSYTRYV
jgi:hypothetical protein